MDIFGNMVIFELSIMKFTTQCDVVRKCLGKVALVVEMTKIICGKVQRFIRRSCLYFSCWVVQLCGSCVGIRAILYIFCWQNKRSNLKMTGFTESALVKRLMDLNPSQQSIQTLSLWLIHHRKHHPTIVKVWFKEMCKGTWRLS